jgi:ribosomal protein S18 acetylase RimI-like enzyme
VPPDIREPVEFTRRQDTSAMITLLDNIIWNSLSGTQAKYAAGTGAARRYAPGFSPIVAFADAENPDFAALAPFCERGEHLYCDRWSGAPPVGWHIDVDSRMVKMIWQAACPTKDEAPDAIALHPEHAAQAMALAELTKPGPFGPRTIELGDYFGYFEGGRLIAMAGERMQAGMLREISGVCTHPEHQGRGYARRLMLKLVRRQMQRGEQTFLHVMSENAGARRLYEKMGFRDYLETVVRVISRV